MFGSQPPVPVEPWQYQLNQFVKKYPHELAALTWGMAQQNEGEEGSLMGIDLYPEPHFVDCPRATIEQLNRNVNGFLQEILGIIDNHNPETEVVMLSIGHSQVNLIHFEVEQPPATYFENLGESLVELYDRLEAEMMATIPIKPKPVVN
ncbi:MAG: hypothetical protein HC796_04375 [Synechococcaceae cyanobacterium RL_1_2]|nr:hypothetical protein [Synechococcaceae cyanobacterium RL_1_2]